MIKKIYRGESGGVFKVVLPSGKSRPLRHLVLHSPTGFGWDGAHSHEHEHPAEEHEHDHMPDIHHRHGHEEAN